MSSPHASTPQRCDVLIVGSGAAGMCAAIEAGEAGLNTVVLEAAPTFGGAAIISGGGTCIAGTPLQRERGVEDSPDLAFDDWMRWGGAEADPVWARFYLERSCEDLFVWAQQRGVEWQGLRQQEGNSAPRWHQPKGGGAGFMARMFEAVEPLPVTLQPSSPVTSLLVDGGRVVGVELEREGQRRGMQAGAVLIATGGYSGNPEMVRRYGPRLAPGARILCGGAVTSNGSGHRMLETVGAGFTGMEHLWTYMYGMFDHLDATGTRGVAVRGVEHELWVNAEGRRFHDETKRGGATGTPAVMAQPGATCWSIFDSREAGLLTLADPRFRSSGDTSAADQVAAFLASSPYLHRADTIPELAERAGLPAQAVVETVEEFNGWLREGLSKDPRFGRPLAGFPPIVEPPFYALRYFLLARKCFGGVHTDLSCRVLRAGGGVIPGLYAAGEVAGMAGGHINGRAGLEGTMFGPSLFSGRVAGRAIARGETEAYASGGLPAAAR